jgi:tRNA-specific 2-thiouridylase
MTPCPTLPDAPLPTLDGVPAGARVVVAMSGGVDSSVVAALLKRARYDVIGLTLQLYDHGAATHRKGACCAGQDIHDARRVADALDFPHYVLDYEGRFRRDVMESFADSYLAGETPLPCALCNQKIKFKGLLETARELGAAALATGHYVLRREGRSGPELCRPADAARDQTYFLFGTTRTQLKFLRFPLGAWRKDDARALARQMRLPVAGKHDSQDICFVPSGRYTEVVARMRPGAVEPGDIVHIDGRVLGRHAGIINFTVGQRRGLGLTGPHSLFVVRLDAKRREVVVGPRSSLRASLLTLRNVNWLGDDPIGKVGRGGLALHVRVRSSQAPQAATLFIQDGVASVLLHEGEHGVATGQACVFYADSSAQARMLGGGWIAATSQVSADTATEPISARNPDAQSVAVRAVPE